MIRGQNIDEMDKSRWYFIFALMLILGEIMTSPALAQSKKPASDTAHGRSIIDSLFDILDSVDTHRFEMDSIVSLAVDNNYRISDSSFSNFVVRQLDSCLDTLDLITRHLSNGLKDSIRIELKDYRHSLNNFIAACQSLSDDNNRVGEDNMRSYEDTRFRLLFAKSSVLRALNSYQSLIKEDVILVKTDTVHRSIDSGFRLTDSLISIPDTLTKIFTASYVSNELFGVGWLQLLGHPHVIAVGGDVFAQLGTLHNGMNGRPTYNGIGGDAEFGLSYLHFLFVGGPAVLQVARPEDNTNLVYRPVTLLSWHGGIFYHYKAIGIGLIYSPLYGAGIRVHYWWR
jgi:hypothetical protein